MKDAKTVREVLDERDIQFSFPNLKNLSD